jgi:hypothetical protein
MGIFLSVFLLEGPGRSYIITNPNVSSRKENNSSPFDRSANTLETLREIEGDAVVIW